MNAETLSNGGTSASHEYVTVEHRFERKEGGIVGTIEIDPTGRKPVVMAHVVNELPSDLPIEDVGFNSDAEPQMGSITSHAVSIKQTVEDDPVRIEYGIKLSEPVEEVSFDPPRLEDVEAAELTRSSATRTDGGAEPVAEGDEGNGSSGSLSSIMSLFGRRSTDAESDGPIPGGAASEPSPAHDRSPSGRPDDVDAEPTADDAGGGTDAPDEADGNTDGRVGGVDGADGVVDTGSEQAGTEASGDEREPFSWGVATADEGAPRSETESSAPSGPDSEPDPMTGNDPATGSDRPRAGPDGASARADRRSVEARIDQLTLRVEEFAAYATALEELIDEHGPATEFLERTESELAELDERLGAVRQEVESVRGDHGEELDDLRDEVATLDQRIDSARGELAAGIDEVDDRVDAVDDEVGRVDDAVERLDADLLEQGSAVERIDEEVSALDERIAGVETEVRDVSEAVRSVEEDVATVSEEVSAMREEMESLRAEVEAFSDVRRSLATAFDLPSEAEAPGED